MYSKEELRIQLRESLDITIREVNRALRGENAEALEGVIKRIGRGEIPTWYKQLRENQSLPNLDGKTIGSVLELLLVAVLETVTFKNISLPPLRVSPARGLDLPDLDLSIKSPSENYCTSEPFFSAYERLIGSEYDALVMLTDYQTAKKKRPLKLQIIKYKYLKNNQLADYRLCSIAKKHREWLVQENEAWAKRVCQFLAYVNQSDWRARQLIKLVEMMDNKREISSSIQKADKDFDRTNKERLDKGREPLPLSDLESLKKIQSIQPLHLGVIDAAENWVVDTQKDFARFPNDSEWNRLLNSPLDGKITMSPA